MITPAFSLTATERVLPKMALDFTTASLDGRVTFTRALATATRVNASGLIETVAADTPRFDYNPVTLACKGLLIEESRINLLTHSSNFSQAVWINNTTTVSSTEVAPDGTASAYLLNDTGGTYQSVQRQAVQTITANAAYTTSVFIKKTTGAVTNYPGVAVALTGVSTKAAYAILNTTAGTAALDSSSNINTQAVTVVDYGTYWRVQLNFQDNASNTQARVTIYPALSSNGTSISASATGLATVWGAQLEAGAFATSYIPTTTTALTRNADVATMTGTNFSDWYNATEGTLSVNSVPIYTGAGERVLVTVNNGTAGTRIDLLRSNSGVVSFIAPTLIQDGAYGNGGTIVGAYKDSSAALAFNGGSVFTTASNTVPSGINRLQFGRRADNASLFNGHLSSFKYWPQRLTNNEVQSFSKG